VCLYVATVFAVMRYCGEGGGGGDWICAIAFSAIVSCTVAIAALPVAVPRRSVPVVFSAATTAVYTAATKKYGTTGRQKDGR